MNARIPALFLALALAGCGAADPPADDASSLSSPSDPSVAAEDIPTSGADQGTFVFDEETGAFHGSVVVEGYPEIVRVPEAFCEVDCPVYDYVFFTLLQPIDPTLAQFLDINDGNAYAGPGAIGLGCVQDDTIVYANATDDEGMLDHYLDAEATSVLLSAQPGSPVRLRLARGILTDGSGAPTCYAHFLTTDVIVPGDEPDEGAADDEGTGPTVAGGCVVGGCSGELCADPAGGEVVSNCIWKEEFACYRSASCGRREDGSCGWDLTDELSACLLEAGT